MAGFHCIFNYIPVTFMVQKEQNNFTYTSLVCFPRYAGAIWYLFSVFLALVRNLLAVQKKRPNIAKVVDDAVDVKFHKCS